MLQKPLMHCSPRWQQSLAERQASSVSAQRSVGGGTQLPLVQKPEQQRVPLSQRWP